MSTLLSEQPLVVSLMLGVLAAGLIYGWMQTGKKEAGIAGLAFVALIPLAWVIAAYWETDRERIETLIYEVADAVQQNDHERAVAVIGDDETRARAQRELQNWTFALARVNKIRSIDVAENDFPMQADVDMSVTVDVSTARASGQRFKVPRRLLLRFEKFDDDWLVIEYRHMPIVGGPDRFSNVRNQ